MTDSHTHATVETPKPQIFDTQHGAKAIALPAGWTVKDAELDPSKAATPERTILTVDAHEVGGFISYVNRFKDERTALYCSSDARPSLEGRLDDHQPGKPSHVDHVITFGCSTTEEWQRWLGINKKKLDQKTFAEFIEDNLRDVVEPTGHEFLTAITNFSDSRSVQFSSAQRLSDGMVQFSYTEKENAQQVRFPTAIKIAVPVFMGVDTRYAVTARVKYQLKDGDLALWLELDRPDLVKREAYAELLKLVEAATELEVHRAM